MERDLEMAKAPIAPSTPAPSIAPPTSTDPIAPTEPSPPAATTASAEPIAPPASVSTTASGRAFDLFFAGLMAIPSAPIVALLALLVRLDSPGPAFLRQPRVGRDGMPFRMWKLRTMVADADPSYHQERVRRLIRGAGRGEPSAWLSSGDDPRLTRVGRALRATGLDELPQLLNVLMGEMSLVGPRPALPYELPLWKEWHRGRLAVRPGITGLWQVSGRGTADFDAMVRLDLEYIAHRSLLRDAWILLRTPPAAVRAARRAQTRDDDPM